MTRVLTVAVLMGGSSAEAVVSRNSAAQIIDALQQKGHLAHPIELDNHLASALAALQPDVVFPALHGPPGEDGTVQGFLEILGYHYVGSDVRGSALAMDKHVAKLICRQHGLPVLPDKVVNQGEDLEKVASIIEQTMGGSLVIKPLNQGSAIGVTPLPNGGDLIAALQSALPFGACMVEPFLIGKEVTVGVLERERELLAHPAIEIDTDDDQWYDYDNRYTAGQSEHIIPARLDTRTLSRLQEIALTAHKALGLRDLSRADFIVADDGQIALLEVNSLPGMTSTSLYPDGARHLGYDFVELIDFLVTQATQRPA